MVESKQNPEVVTTIQPAKLTLAEVQERLRAEARERKGWIMDTYLLRRYPEGR